jgi:CheY-like chemotaxis protein
LPAVSDLVRPFGGRVALAITPGRGMTYSILLPCSDEGTSADTPPAGADPAPAGDCESPGPGVGETVLVVEDHQAVRALVRDVLRPGGYTVLEARHGAAAPELCRENPQRIHLLVTDVVMPRLNGRLLAQQLAALRPGLKVLFISGHPVGPAEGEPDALAGSALLRKPFTPEQLTLAVRSLLAGVGDQGGGQRTHLPDP